MKIPRPELIAQLFESVRSGNALLVGDPGIGKSWAMRELRTLAQGQKIPVELIAIDGIYAEDEAELNAYVGWRDGLVAYLRTRAATPQNKGILLFDAFDAARSDRKRNLFLRLIRRCITELRDEWDVMVSVRTFDAQKSRELIRLFPATGVQGVPQGRTVSIPLLTEQEVSVGLSNDAKLAALYERCAAELRVILHVPFNLWLLEQIAASTSDADVSDMYTATELLTLFWQCRVHQEGSRDKNEAILRRVVIDQVSSKQLVSLRTAVFVAEFTEAWDQMFSANVLEEDRGTKNGVRFTHNILFDFAVAQLLVPDEPVRLAAFMAADPARPLFLRPSLVYHFEDQFRRRPERFWSNFFEACKSQHPTMTPVTRLILPTVLVTEGRQIEDFQPLIDALSVDEEYAATALTYVMQAIRTVDFNRPEAQRKYRLWAELLTRVTGYLDEKFAWDVGSINEQVLQYAQRL
jgi:hypothetical protein